MVKLKLATKVLLLKNDLKVELVVIGKKKKSTIRMVFN